jgi:hypothetical protein
MRTRSASLEVSQQLEPASERVRISGQRRALTHEIV